MTADEFVLTLRVKEAWLRRLGEFSLDLNRLSKVSIQLGDRIYDFPRNTWGPDAAFHHRDHVLADRALREGKVYLGIDSRSRSIYADERQASRLRALVRGASLSVPPLYELQEDAVRPYVPGLWLHGERPAFIAPKGWAKTWVTCQLAAALVGGRSFLDWFDPVDMTDEERGRDVVLLNPETSPAAVHEVLLRCGLEPIRQGWPVYRAEDAEDGQGRLIVEHIVQYEGGPSMFDLADDVKAEIVAEMLTSRGSAAPLTVIADGVTAMIGNRTERTGAFASGFMRLLTQAGIPNGLGVLHSPMSAGVDTPMQGLESMAEWHGQWFGSASSFPVEATTARYFRTVPRLGGFTVPRRRLLMGREGLWVLEPLDGAEAGEKVPEGAPDAALEARILDRLTEAHPVRLWTKDLIPDSGNRAFELKALKALEERGEVISESVQEGRTRGTKWSLPTTRPTTEDEEVRRP